MKKIIRIALLILAFIPLARGADSGITSDSEFYARLARSLAASGDWGALEELSKRMRGSVSREVIDFRDYKHDEESSSSRSSAPENCSLALTPVLYAHQKTLTLADLKDDGSRGFDQRLVYSLDLSPKSSSDLVEFTPGELVKIGGLFRKNDLYNLQEINLDGRPNAHEALGMIFYNDKNKSLFSLSRISARRVKVGLVDGSYGDLGRESADLIFGHYLKNYTHLVRDGQQITSYWDRGECIETYAIPFSFYMTTYKGSSTLDWFEGEYKTGSRISKGKKIMCHYRMKDPDTMAPFYLKIEVDVAH